MQAGTIFILELEGRVLATLNTEFTSKLELEQKTRQALQAYPAAAIAEAWSGPVCVLRVEAERGARLL